MTAIRAGGHVRLRDYAVIGDGRSAALVAADGSVDWLGLPDLDSPSLFAAVLDPARGGRFLLEPEEPCTVARRYLPGTNVLETTFTTGRGTARVTDALTLDGGGALGPMRELQRRLDGVAGTVPMRWSVQPRFGYGARRPRFTSRGGVPVVTAGADALAVRAWDAGEPRCDGGAISGRLDLCQGRRALLAMPFAHQEPLVLPTRAECDARLERTIAVWRGWAAERRFGGMWRDAVLRSALALKLLIFAPSGAIAAAATCSLPEDVGGERNWDYRFCWVRDSVFTLDALLRLGCSAEADAFFWWLMHATQLTHPRLRVLYRLDGGARAPERTLPLAGYRGSRPVRAGNAAGAQLQLDTYGELLQTGWLYAGATGRLDADIARRLAELADLVCTAWRRPDSGIWEVRSAPLHFTQSKMMCWIALDRAIDLSGRGLIPDRGAARWRTARDQVRDFVETRCFSADRRCYTRSADSPELDAAVLLGLLHGYAPPGDPRMRATVDAIGRELRHGPYVARYSGEDGLAGTEGAFLACSFWLAECLARTGRLGEAVALMDELVGLANDVGLYSEEIDPDTGAFLGNLPQGLSHLALISAACAIGSAAGEAGR
ncbi:glycoside hydrolase family 15 protein [Actinomadura livida]|uniref:GH15 family glucan-1,4-alpha-glucosidase n=1 Tax=Actinomadura livida TaxID=79909 RepID=A0A7W7MYQ5_9ACTN|nr:MULTISPECIES: glycoside hydrolase family 15 protein [Actinomadura]MBB4776018.1 GH15 family glucan-1,4-alpha-glucosidase [Actinomadura catellatispora]GGU16066.1 glycosyl hydrolase [Actinomadura livida]